MKKTSTKRVQALRKRRDEAEEKFTRHEHHYHDDDHPTVVDVVSELNKKRIENYIERAKAAIELRGWSISEKSEFSPNKKGEIHLIIVKEDQLKGWGLFTPLYCWSEAYEAVTGNKWIELIEKT